MRVLRDRTSHMYAEDNDFLFPPSEAAYIAYWERDLFVLDNTAKRALWKPIPRPWERPKKKPVMTNRLRSMLLKRAGRMTTNE